MMSENTLERYSAKTWEAHPLRISVDLALLQVHQDARNSLEGMEKTPSE
jgi:hypothetical protein